MWASHSTERHKVAGSDRITLRATDRNCIAYFFTAVIKPYKNKKLKEKGVSYSGSHLLKSTVYGGRRYGQPLNARLGDLSLVSLSEIQASPAPYFLD